MSNNHENYVRNSLTLFSPWMWNVIALRKVFAKKSNTVFYIKIKSVHIR